MSKAMTVSMVSREAAEAAIWSTITSGGRNPAGQAAFLNAKGWSTFLCQDSASEPSVGSVTVSRPFNL